MSEATDDKTVAVMMGRLRALNSGDPFAINRKIREGSLEYVARRIIEMHSFDADEAKIIAALSRILGERGGSVHFKTNRQVRQELDARWRSTAKRYPNPGATLLKQKKTSYA